MIAGVESADKKPLREAEINSSSPQIRRPLIHGAVYLRARVCKRNRGSIHGQLSPSDVGKAKQ